MGEECHVAEGWVKIPAEEPGWSLTLGTEGLSGLPHQPKTGPKWVWKGLVEFSTIFNGSTLGAVRPISMPNEADLCVSP